MARFTELDIFRCICGEYVVMGRKCPVCGKTNADALEEKEKTEQPKERKKKGSKFRKPSPEGTFIQSFYFPKPKK